MRQIILFFLFLSFSLTVFSQNDTTQVENVENKTQVKSSKVKIDELFLKNLKS